MHKVKMTHERFKDTFTAKYQGVRCIAHAKLKNKNLKENEIILFQQGISNPPRKGNITRLKP